ncbi:hypothetical protein CTRI78_v011154 [Colletotrichum trifolii]|uniref:Wings apart-like protein C-terminal domain-containing protein n=1 Tax=Colletotrichum trifolii TaxID=5466 RepID=A0A4R8QET3_COLTR|nr:hypothetical protein CTRI78_v011154 [Colletotrichum trifolii]
MQRFKSILGTAAEVSSRSSGRRRVRLIDQLAAQIEDFYESDSGDSRLSEGVDGHPVRSPAVVTKLVEPVGSTPKLPTRPKPLASTRKLRSTYGEHRSLRPNESEEGLGNYTAICDDQDKLSPPPSLSKMPSFPLEEESLDEELSPTGGIIDIHALRQAGANHRFADMMVDLLDRVGSPQPPSSPLSRTRRTALLELASNFQDKVYVRQFRDQAAKDALFKAIGAEEDIVCGFALFSILLVMFSSHSVPHLIPLLHTEGMAQLALRLFNIEDDILRFAIQRRTNLSKTSQATLGVIKSTIQQIDVWKGMPPPVLSPRTLALKAVSEICRDNDSPDTRQILANLTDRLFDFVHNGWEVSRDDGMAVTDGGIALCLLESYSIAAMESDAGPIWTSRHLPVVADMITSAMARPVMNCGEFECTALKLALNTTNNNPAAANVFSRGELLSVLAETSLGAFELLQQSVCSGAFSKEVYEMLMLTLGILINTSEHCISTHESVDAWQAQSRSPLNKLMDFYLDNRESSVMVRKQADLSRHWRPSG